MYRGFKLSGTMAMSVPASQSVGVAQSPPLQDLPRPERAQIPNHDLERAVPRSLEEMDSFELKQRGNVTRNADDNAETSAGSSPTTLTPSSSRGEVSQGMWP